MTKKYSRQERDTSTSAKSRGSYLKVSFKNTRETAHAIKGLTLKRAKAYLQDVIDHKDVIPFRRFTGGISRAAGAKNHKASQARWTVKASTFLLDLLVNAESNADAKGINNTDDMVVEHVQVNRAPETRRRTYRAHGRISAWNAHPCHVELILAHASAPVAKGEGAAAGAAPKRLENGATGF